MAQNYIPRGSRTVDVQPLPDSMWQRYNNRPGLLSSLARAYRFYDELSPEGQQRIAKLFEGKKEPSGREQIRALDPTATTPIPGYDPPVKEPVFGKSAAEYESEHQHDMDAAGDRADQWATEREAEEEAYRAWLKAQPQAYTDKKPVELSASLIPQPEPLQIKGEANLRTDGLTRGEKFAEQIMDAQEKRKENTSEEGIVGLIIDDIMRLYE